MRGQGRRRGSPGSGNELSAAAQDQQRLRDGGIRRKPVPSTVMEASEAGSPRPRSAEIIDPRAAQSSAARALVGGETTPGVDDAPYIRFALDQLTRDEEVMGSRQQSHRGESYRGLGSGVPGQYPYLVPGASKAIPGVGKYEIENKVLRDSNDNPRYGTATIYPGTQERQGQVPLISYEGDRSVAEPQAAWLRDREMNEKERIDEPPPRNPMRVSEGNSDPRDFQMDFAPIHQQQRQQASAVPGNLVPIAADSSLHNALDFLPGILRPAALLVFLLLLLLFLACLVFTAIWSLTHKGLWNYEGFGGGRYFLFNYLPTLLGIILFLWVVQIEVAVFRITPFIAMAAESSIKSREHGANLPMYPQGFVLPYFGHLKAGQTVVTTFLFLAWLQIFTVPLLATAYNVYYNGAPTSGQWRWIATQGAIWSVVVLYAVLAIATVLLMLWLRKKTTGVQWDPRSLADLIVLSQGSNALGRGSSGEPARLGYWRDDARPNAVFHTYGAGGKPVRQPGHYQDLSMSEKSEDRYIPPPTSRFSDPDLERGDEHRHSRDKMLPKPGDREDGHKVRGSALPWFLKPVMAMLWIVIALVLLLAFLIVSYLPSTRVSDGFLPDVPAPVSTAGFSATNFLYSFLPALLGMFCLLFWLRIDYAYRRLQPFASLMSPKGELAERSLLLSYAADMPLVVTASAVVNGHWKVAVTSFTTLIAAALPILGGGIFWAQFYVPTQRTRISAHLPAYYALTVLCVLYALAYFFIFPSKRLRNANKVMKEAGSRGLSFHDTLVLVRYSQMLDDEAFRTPLSKAALVTRLISAPMDLRIGRHEEAEASKLSLADSVRGFGRARAARQGAALSGDVEVARYSLSSSGARGAGIERVMV